jgi:hypothetical protein
MTDASAREALLVGKGTRQRTGWGFVAWTTSFNLEDQSSGREQRRTRLLAIETEPFFSTVGATRESKAEKVSSRRKLTQGDQLH